jgi:polyhydroxybutyrate depolymerase
MRVRRSLRVALVMSVTGLLLAVAIAVFGRAGSAPAVRAQSPDAATACALPAGRTVRVAVPVAGQGTRSALVHLPRTPSDHPLALIVALHGAYGDGAFMERYSGLSRLADRAGFAVVYPDARGNFWQIAAKQSGADVQFIDALIDHVLAGGCFDARRVSAVGVSNGAGMAVRFACAGDDRLAGVVAVAGAYGTLPPCKARRPLSLLEVHGTADAVVPYRGSPADPGSDVLGFVKDWADRDACRAVPRVTRERAGVERLDWTGCRDATEIAHLRLIGGTHTWPGTEPPAPGPQLGVSASDEAWRFLRDRRLAPRNEHDGG